MPKRVGFLYERLTDKDFLKACVKETLKKKKKKRRDVKKVAKDVDATVDRMYRIFADYDYTPTEPKIKVIYDKCSKKERELAIQPFNHDGVILAAITEVLKPVIMRGMHFWSCSSVKGRGAKRMLAYNVRVAQQKARNSKYVAELDIKKYYPSVPLKKVIAALERKIKDKKFLLLIAVAASSYPQGLKYAMEHNLSPYDVVGDKVGLHIGMILSQWLGNFYLEALDRYILTLDGVYYESRNMDNIIIAGRNKRKLHRAVDAISAYMSELLGVTLKSDWQVFKVYQDKHYTEKGKEKVKRSRRIATVGYRISRDRITICKKNFLRLIRQCRRAMKKLRQGLSIPVKMAQGIISRIGQLKHCTDSFHAYDKYVYPIGIGKLKKIISNDAKRRNALLKGAA